jgi:glycogen synthase
LGDSNVLLVGPVPPPTGGIAAHIEALARVLRTRGVAVTIADPARSRLKLLTELGKTRLAGGVIHVHVCGHNPKSYGLIAACLAAAGPRPVLATLHSGLLPAFLDDVSSTGRRTIAGILRRCAQVICVSPPVAVSVRDLGVDNISIAPAFLAEGVRPAYPPARVEALRQESAYLLAAAVAPGVEYGAEILAGGFARVAAAHPGTNLVVFGPGGADRAVARSLEERGLPDRVLAAGELAHPTALGVMSTADVFLRPTLADGDAMSVREALALDRPVIASDAAPRPPGVITFRAGDALDLARAVDDVMAGAAPARDPGDGFPHLAAVYRGVGLMPQTDLEEDTTCVASPDA